MKAFTYVTADDFEAASRELAAAGDRAMAKSGGTDLLDLLKSRLLQPDEVVSLLRAKRDTQKGELSALLTLAEVAEDSWIRENFPAVAKAALEAATPQVRNTGTLGGNLCQHTRCWYFRDANYTCFKRGTGDCSAAPDGAQNRYHAIFPHSRCVSAHPSNLAPALIAVGARVACVHPDGARTLDAELLYDEGPSGRKTDTTLRPGELIRAVLLEPTPLSEAVHLRRVPRAAELRLRDRVRGRVARPRGRHRARRADRLRRRVADPVPREGRRGGPPGQEARHRGCGRGGGRRRDAASGQRVQGPDPEGAGPARAHGALVVRQPPRPPSSASKELAS